MKTTTTPIGRLVLFLLEHCGGRAASIYLQELPSGAQKELKQTVHFWTVRGKPLLIQSTRDGGYDVFVPLLDSLSIEETERAIVEYASGERVWATLRAAAPAQSDSALPEGTIDALNPETPSESKPDAPAATLARNRPCPCRRMRASDCAGECGWADQ